MKFFALLLKGKCYSFLDLAKGRVKKYIEVEKKEKRETKRAIKKKRGLAPSKKKKRGRKKRAKWSN